MIRNALVWLMDNLYNYMIPVCLLCVLRIVMCLVELRHMNRLREKKFVFRKMAGHYAEIGIFAGVLIGSILICVLPLKLLWTALTVVLGIIGYKVGKKKGETVDAFWREVIAEMTASEDAEKLESAPDVDHTLGGFIDTIDLYDEEETPAAGEDGKNEEA